MPTKKKTTKTTSKKQVVQSKIVEKKPPIQKTVTYEEALKKANVSKAQVNRYGAVVIVDNVIIAPPNKVVLVKEGNEYKIKTDGDRFDGEVVGVIDILEPNKII